MSINVTNRVHFNMMITYSLLLTKCAVCVTMPYGLMQKYI